MKFLLHECQQLVIIIGRHVLLETKEILRLLSATFGNDVVKHG